MRGATPSIDGIYGLKQMRVFKMANDKAKRKAAKKVEKAVRKAVKKGVTESAVEKAVSLGMANGVKKKPIGEAAAATDVRDAKIA
jgi:hypothetical protein